MFGRMLDDRLGKVHFWLTFIGFHTTFLVQHWLGAEGMHRRVADYLPTDGFTTLNTISTIGASTLPFLYNVWKSYKVGEQVTADDPWGFGNSLEWATSSPPPLRNFDRMPRIRSERPAFDAKFPDLAAGEQSASRPPEGGARPLTSESHGGARYREQEDERLDKDR
jgi:cytochrome c oxidase subunit I